MLLQAPRARDIKYAVLRAITASGVANLFRPLTRGAAVVFMLHRFSGPGHGGTGHDPRAVRALLEHLRRSKHQLVDVGTLFASLRGEGPPLRHAVAFTIDDGYSEHASIAAPLFAAFDCPVTTFVTTGFLDGALWFWWDKIQYVFAQSARTSVRVTVNDDTLQYALGDAHGRRAAAENLTFRGKALSDEARAELIRTVAATAEVELPDRAPTSYEPMTWDELRRCERGGMTFGPHTVTHPFLGRISDDSARYEIIHSWKRLQAEANNPVPVFAYPNGLPGDFGTREFGILTDAGLVGAVTGVEGFVTKERYRAPNGAFLTPRFPMPDSLPYLIQQVNGLERFKLMLRGDERL